MHFEMTSLPDIVPTDFKVTVRSTIPWQPPAIIHHRCRWLDDLLEFLIQKDIDLERVIAVEYQAASSLKWITIQPIELREAIARIQAATGGRQ